MSSAMDPNLKYWLGFNLVKGIGPAKLRTLLDLYGSIADAWKVSEHGLVQAGIDRRTINGFINTRATVDLDTELGNVLKAGIKLLVWDSKNYPRYLKEIANPPPLIYMRGDISEADQWAVAIVGTRRLTTYGRQVTMELVHGLVHNKITIVSGLARGIDTIAHKTAVEMGGRTIGVQGSGLDDFRI